MWDETFSRRQNVVLTLSTGIVSLGKFKIIFFMWSHLVLLCDVNK